MCFASVGILNLVADQMSNWIAIVYFVFSLLSATYPDYATANVQVINWSGHTRISLKIIVIHPCINVHFSHQVLYWFQTTN